MIQEGKARPVHKEIRVQQAQPVHKERQEQQAHKDQLVQLVLQV